MTHKESVIAFVISLALLAGGLTWLFGPYGMIGVGAALLLIALLVPERGE